MKKYYCTDCKTGITKQSKSGKCISCVQKGHTAWNKKKKIKLICEYCGKEFKVRPSRKDTAKYCCYKCHQIGIALGNKGRLGQTRSEEELKKHSKSMTGKKLSEEAKRKISKKAKERWKNKEWVKNLIIKQRKDGLGFSVESRKHVYIKKRYKKVLEKVHKCSNVYLEYPVYVKNKLYIVDIIGFGGEMWDTVIVEVGGCKKEKLKDLKTKFDLVIHLPYCRTLDLFGG